MSVNFSLVLKFFGLAMSWYLFFTVNRGVSDTKLSNHTVPYVSDDVAYRFDGG